MAQEPLKPGAYTALGKMNIRAAMNTFVEANIVGGYSNGEPFTVYEVYPEVGGIVWGRVSSNTGGGSARYVALRVNNHPKAQMVLDEIEPQPENDVMMWIKDIDAWARSQGFRGQHPF